MMLLGSLNNVVGTWQNRLAPLNFSIYSPHAFNCKLDTTRERTEWLQQAASGVKLTLTIYT